MNMENVPEIVKDAFADKEFVAALAKITTAEDAQKAFADKGIELSLEEVQQIGDLMAQRDELGEDDLDSVAGGWAITTGVALIIGGILVCVAIAGIKILWGKLNSSLK